MDKNRKERLRYLKENDPEGYAEWRERENARSRKYYRRLRERDPEKLRKKGRLDGRRRYADPVKKEIIKARNNKFARERKAWFQELKGTLSCEECEIAHPAMLLFHHLDPSQKDAPISIMVGHLGRSREVITAEIKKCAVLCANCHAVFHHLYGMTGFPKYQKGMIIRNGKHRKCAVRVG